MDKKANHKDLEDFKDFEIQIRYFFVF